MDNEASELGSALKTFSELEQLTVNFENCELGDEGFVYFEDAILSMQNLDYLKLNVTKNGLSEEMITRIMNEFNLMTNLEHFELKARQNCAMNNKQRDIVYNTAMEMKNLRTKKALFC